MRYFPYVVLVFILGLMVVMFQFNQTESVSAKEYDCLRIHIRANSNDEEDQEIKYEVKSKIVNFLTPYLQNIETKEEAMTIVKENLAVLETIVDNTLSLGQFDYDSKCGLTKEYFPTRYYENSLLEEGEYDALIVTLGEGEGDNWWCVVYPPLCFVNKNQNQEQNIVYNSRFLEIIKNFFD